MDVFEYLEKRKQEIEKETGRTRDKFIDEDILSIYDLYKENETGKIWWVDNIDTLGEHLFTFDKKKIYNLFKDYPHNLSTKEREIFDKENPYWKNHFSKR